MTMATSTPTDRDHLGLADLILCRALALMAERDVPSDVTIDRLTTFAAGAHVRVCGAQIAAQAFRDYADQIEAGAFDQGKSAHAH